MLKNLMMGTAALALSATGMAGAANATIFTSTGLLTPCAEVDIVGAGTGDACPTGVNPATFSTNSGTFTVSYDDVATLLSITFAYTGLTNSTPADPPALTAWHIHGPFGAQGPSDRDHNGFIALDGVAIFGGPIPPPDFADNPFVGSVVITPSLASAFGTSVAGFGATITSGLFYLNIHSDAFPTGELRAQLFDVPEPASMSLLGAGIMGLGYFGRRRKAA